MTLRLAAAALNLWPLESSWAATRAVRIDEASNVSRPGPSGADQIDAEPQAMDLAIVVSAECDLAD